MIQKITATVALGVIAILTTPIMFYGSMMSAFGLGQRSDPGGAVLLTIAICLGLIICIWIRSRLSLAVGGFILSPVLLIGCILVTADPAGFVLLIPVLIWYACAFSLWRKYANQSSLLDPPKSSQSDP